jgi:ParB/RepB/Spo0J family partition protein
MANQTARVDEIEIKENIRQEFGEKDLKEMAESIKLYGIIVPLVVRKTGNKLVLVDGERRLRSAKLVGLSEVPITYAIGKIKDDEMKQLITAIHRKNLSSLELARYYKKLSANMTQADIAKIVCKTQAHVSQILKLNELSLRHKAKIKKGESYAKVLKKFSPDYKEEPSVSEPFPISGKSAEDKPPLSATKASQPPANSAEQTEDDATPPPSIIRSSDNADTELLSFEISAASPDRVAQELKAKLEEREFDGAVRISLKISELKDEDIERALTDDGVYGFFDDAGNFTELA